MTTKQETNYSTVTLATTPTTDKEFLKELLQLTSMQVSWTELLPGESSDYLHSHEQNEELYINLQGQGQIQVDGDTLDFSQGVFVRVAPAGKRAMRNIGTTPLHYLCIQARSNSLQQWSGEDGTLHREELVWPAL